MLNVNISGKIMSYGLDGEGLELRLYIVRFRIGDRLGLRLKLRIR